MSGLSDVVKLLHKQREQTQKELSRLDAAINALKGVGAKVGATRSRSQRPRRAMSASARKKIAAAQRARWAAWKAKQKKA
jgi:hypothetical protein